MRVEEINHCARLEWNDGCPSAPKCRVYCCDGSDGAKSLRIGFPNAIYVFKQGELHVMWRGNRVGQREACGVHFPVLWSTSNARHETGGKPTPARAAF